MASRYRPATPPYGRRMLGPERASTGGYGQPESTASYDPYYPRDRRESHTSPRSSGERVIPVSTETYRNGSLVSSSRPGAAYDPYGDSRRTGLPLPDTGQRRSLHQPSSSTSAAHSRGGPAVIHQNPDRLSNGSSRWNDRYDRGGYYITPASSTGRRRHRKTYSIDDDKRSRLVDNGDRDADIGQEPRRRDTRYHLTGPSKKRSEENDYIAYEYASPREVFENTEPRRQTRRRGSVDAPSRDRPTASIGNYAPSRPRPREIEAPPPTKSTERINNGGGVAKQDSLRDQARSPPRNAHRRSFESHSEDDDYYVAPRRRRNEPEPSYYDHDGSYSPTRDELAGRRHPLTTLHRFEDTDVANRGFGIRAASIDPEHSREASVDAKGRYATEQRQPPPPPDYPAETRRGDRKWDADARQRDRGSELEREAEIPRRKERERERPHAEETATRDKHAEDAVEPSRRDKPRDSRRADGGSVASGVLPALAAGTAVAAASEVADHKKSDDSRHRAADTKEDDSSRAQEEPGLDLADETTTRERHYITKDDQREAGPASGGDDASAPMDPDEEFRLRIQQEANRAKQSKAGPSRTTNGVPRAQSTRDEGPSEMRGPRQRHRAPNDLESESDDDDDDEDEDKRGAEDTSRALTLRPESDGNVLGTALTSEPGEMYEDRESRVRIVEPAKEKEAPRGILRKPTEKFPEYADAVREGVAPHKNSKKEGIPDGAKWTKIARAIINPQALKEAEERFEEREDFVIVLRALSREEIQKLADRTKEIRGKANPLSTQARLDADIKAPDEREYRHHRDRRHRRRDYDDEDDDYYDH